MQSDTETCAAKQNVNLQDKIIVNTFMMEITPRCNQQCIYCYNAWREDNGREIGEPATADFKKIIDTIANQAEVKFFTLTGGEPFLREDIFQIIDWINEKGMVVNIISNGGMITPEIAKQLSRRKVNYVQITLGGANAETHDHLCGDGTFEKAKNAMKVLQKNGVMAGGSYLCTSYNYQQANDVLECFASLNVKQIAINRFSPGGEPRRINLEILPTRSQVIEALDAAEEKAVKHDLKLYNTMPIPPCVVDMQKYPHIKFSGCSAGYYEKQLAIGPDGQVRLCTLQKQRAGSILDLPLKEIIESETVTGFRKEIPEFCRECPFASACLGGCGAAADWVFGTTAEVDPFVGQHVLPDYEERVREQLAKQEKTA